MDGLLSPCSSFSPPSPASFSHVGNPVIEFASCEVPEQWLHDVVAPKYEGYDHGDEELVWPMGCTRSPASEHSEKPPPQQQDPSVTAPAQRSAGIKRRARKPGPRQDVPFVSHVEAERKRRDKQNRLFCDLRAAVPTVSRMDKASLLADAASYITELRARVARLEAEAKRAGPKTRPWEPVTASRGGAVEEAVEVRMVGSDAAAVRVLGGDPHAPARLMDALRALDLNVQHACVSRVNGVTVQDVVVDVPTRLLDGEGLRTLLAQMLQGSGCS